jgi:Tfp pilus assembly protein PilN
MRAVNLIPSEQRSTGGVGTRSGGAAFLVLALLGGFALLALLYGRSHHELEARRAEAAALTQRAQEVQQQASRLSPYASFMAMREQRLHAIAQLIGSRFDWSNAMGELSRVLPADVALSTVQGAIGAAAEKSGPAPRAAEAAAAAASVSSATPPGSTPTLTLAGCATSQSVVAQTLVRLRLIAGVSAVALQSSTKSGSGGSSCPSNDPVFNVQLTFQALPSPSARTTEALAGSASASAGTGGGATSSAAAYTTPGTVR